MSTANDYTLFNITRTVTPPAPVTFAVATKGEVVIESSGDATLTKGGLVIQLAKGQRQQLKLEDGSYTLAGNARVTLREVSLPKTGVHFGSPDGQPVPGRKYVRR
jgi:hypothetical protein